MITPEGIALPLTLASRGTRLGALTLDLLFIGLLMIGTTMALIAIAGGTANLFGAVQDAGQNAGSLRHALEFLIVLWFAAMFLFRNAYFLFFELGPRGATPGKRITGIRIAARDGGRLTAEMVIARNLLRDIELFMPLVFLASASALPVCEVGCWRTSSGVPVHTTQPPASPPSGPRSINQSAARITSRLCSITSSEWPASSSLRKARISLAMSSKCKPVVGSSNINSVPLRAKA